MSKLSAALSRCIRQRYRQPQAGESHYERLVNRMPGPGSYPPPSHHLASSSPSACSVLLRRRPRLFHSSLPPALPCPAPRATAPTRRLPVSGPASTPCPPQQDIPPAVACAVRRRRVASERATGRQRRRGPLPGRAEDIPSAVSVHRLSTERRSAAPSRLVTPGPAQQKAPQTKPANPCRVSSFRPRTYCATLFTSNACTAKPKSRVVFRAAPSAPSQCLATGTSGSALPWPPLRPRTHRAFHGPTSQPTIERPKLLRRPAPLPGSAAQRLLLTVRSSSHISRGLADLIGRDSCVSNYHRHPRHPASSSSGPAVVLFTAGGSRHLVSASLSSRAFQPFWGIVPVRAPRGTNSSHLDSAKLAILAPSAICERLVSSRPEGPTQVETGTRAQNPPGGVDFSQSARPTPRHCNLVRPSLRSIDTASRSSQPAIEVGSSPLRPRDLDNWSIWRPPSSPPALRAPSATGLPHHTTGGAHRLARTR
ncbi:hypothetical protein ACCO45_001338 [Purpureocillium lilacinum]|uniref:Uncharacterized protein n=1 Tax=Purpureocillium lilacinum TaxID=33203 RepID=A0ACC4E9C2_PURLI